MTPASYKAIDKVLQEQKTDIVQVHRSDLKNIFRELRHYRRMSGFLGYTDDGRPIANERGMSVIVTQAFRDEYPELAEGSDIRIESDINSGVWTVKCYYEPACMCSVKYTLNYLQEKYNVYFQPL